MRKLSFFLIGAAILLSVFAPFAPQAEESGGQGTVYIVPLEKTVEKGLYSFLDRAITTAEENNASHIIFEINTPGGAVDAAADIAKRMSETDIPLTAFVNRNALSAGAYIALNADQIMMVSGAKMGSAAVITGDGNAADKKAQSYWLAEMKNAAELNGRDPKYAMAMADEDIDLPELGAGKGELLTLTARQAIEVGYAEEIVENRDELLKTLGLENASVEEINVSFAEQIARFITHPVVVPILLSIGSLGLVLELYSPGFGIAGSMGIIALVLFFYGHMVAGLAGFEALLLLVAGIIMIVAEFFVPGGILGIIGVGAVIGSFFVSAEDIGHMTLSVSIALAVTAVASILFFRLFGFKSGVFKKIILSDATRTEQGYVSSKTRLDLIGKEGTALTPLRPSGTGVFDDERIDVVSEGGFIASGRPVKIVKTEGSRVIVREINRPAADKSKSEQ
ncbi:NfeD family protein [Bacillus marinisedimentorum]|uniref:NfeD family protein n=1 Tax=Bacillus marinisedimentorum TaxID=1821260 RepID=UPI000872D2D8|nr:nodulation protein NfeD [Bacillus marinisedimentorum]